MKKLAAAFVGAALIACPAFAQPAPAPSGNANSQTGAAGPEAAKPSGGSNEQSPASSQTAAPKPATEGDQPADQPAPNKPAEQSPSR